MLPLFTPPSLFLKDLIYLFNFLLLLAVLGLCCYVWAFL